MRASIRPRATTPGELRHAIFKLADRVNGEAEARGHLAGQFHEALAELVNFTQEAHVAITLNEANVTALTEIQARLIDAFDEYIVYSTERMDALSTALKAVWDVTKPRPTYSLWKSIRALFD